MPESDEAVASRWLRVSNRIIDVLMEERIEHLEAWFIVVQLADYIKKQYKLDVPEMPQPPEPVM